MAEDDQCYACVWRDGAIAIRAPGGLLMHLPPQLLSRSKKLKSIKERYNTTPNFDLLLPQGLLEAWQECADSLATHACSEQVLRLQDTPTLMQYAKAADYFEDKDMLVRVSSVLGPKLLFAADPITSAVTAEQSLSFQTMEHLSVGAAADILRASGTSFEQQLAKLPAVLYPAATQAMFPSLEATAADVGGHLQVRCNEMSTGALSSALRSAAASANLCHVSVALGVLPDANADSLSVCSAQQQQALQSKCSQLQTAIQEVFQSGIHRVTIERVDMSLMHLDWVTAALAASSGLTHLDLDIEIDHAPQLTGPFQVMCALAGGLARLTHLRHLDLNFTPWEFKSDQSLLQGIFRSMTQLTYLDIGQPMHAGAAVSFLSHLTRLSSLHVAIYCDYAAGARQFSGALANLTRLSALTIQVDGLQPSVSDEGCFNCFADALKSLKSLQQLGVGVKPSVVLPWQRSAFPEALATLNALRSLSLTLAGDVTPLIDILPSVPSCAQLTKLLVKARELRCGDTWMCLRNHLPLMTSLLELHALSAPPCSVSSHHYKVQHLSSERLDPALGQLTCLVLDMEWTHESSQNIAGFLAALSAPSKLKTLEISFNDCADNTAANKELMAVLPQALSLQQLHLKHSQLNAEAIRKFAWSCTSISNLTRMHLNEAFDSSTSDSLIELFSQFSCLVNLKQLALLLAGHSEEGHRMSVPAAAALCNAIKCMRSMHVLNIKGWQFARGALEALVPCVQCCEQLQKLRVSHSFMTAADVNVMARAVKATTWLQKLDVSHNYMNDDVMLQLLEALEGHHKLHTLNLAGNLTGSVTVMRMTALLRTAPQLATLQVDVEDVSKAAVTGLLAALLADPLRSPRLRWMCHDRLRQLGA